MKMLWKEGLLTDLVSPPKLLKGGFSSFSDSISTKSLKYWFYVFSCFSRQKEKLSQPRNLRCLFKNMYHKISTI